MTKKEQNKFVQKDPEHCEKITFRLFLNLVMAEEEKEEFGLNEQVFCLNQKYKDGTRLRAEASVDNRNFNGVWAPNDSPVTVLSCPTNGFFPSFPFL